MALGSLFVNLLVGCFSGVGEQFTILNGKVDKIMAALDDVKAAIAGLATSLQTEIADFEAALTAAQQPNGSISAADAAGLITQLAGLKTVADQADAIAKGGTPAPNPTPVTGP